MRYITALATVVLVIATTTFAAVKQSRNTWTVERFWQETSRTRLFIYAFSDSALANSLKLRAAASHPVRNKTLDLQADYRIEFWVDYVLDVNGERTGNAGTTLLVGELDDAGEPTVYIVDTGSTVPSFNAACIDSLWAAGAAYLLGGGLQAFKDSVAAERAANEAAQAFLLAIPAR